MRLSSDLQLSVSLNMELWGESDSNASCSVSGLIPGESGGDSS
jgi:hypothetical protein